MWTYLILEEADVLHLVDDDHRQLDRVDLRELELQQRDLVLQHLKGIQVALYSHDSNYHSELALTAAVAEEDDVLGREAAVLDVLLHAAADNLGDHGSLLITLRSLKRKNCISRSLNSSQELTWNTKSPTNSNSCFLPTLAEYPITVGGVFASPLRLRPWKLFESILTSSPEPNPGWLTPKPMMRALRGRASLALKRELGLVENDAMRSYAELKTSE